MQQSNTISESSNPRNKIVEVFLTSIRDSLNSNNPVIKLVNFGTGSGKTHQYFESIFKTIRDHPDIQVIGLYVAPLREHLRVPPALKKDNADIPLYTLYSNEMKTTEGMLVDYSLWLETLRDNQKLESDLTRIGGKKTSDEAREHIFKAISAISSYQLLKKFGASRIALLKPRLDQSQRDIVGEIDKFLTIYIKAIPDETKWLDECRRLVEIYFPLFLLREYSGILLMTYEKFETEIPYFIEVGQKMVKRTAIFDQYVQAYSSDTRRFIIAFDEQEDGYEAMLSHQIDIVYPKDLAINNALSSIYREFPILFSPANKGNRAFLKFLRKNPGALREWGLYVDKGKQIDPKLLDLASDFRRLTDREGNSPVFLTKIAGIEAGIEASFQDISATFGVFSEDPPVALDFDKLAEVLATFENNRSLLIPRKLYARYAEDLANIFTYNNLYIYNIEVLRSLFIRRENSGNVLIDEREDGRKDAVSVAELIYSMLAVRLQIKAIQELLEKPLDAEDTQSRSLGIWSRQIEKLQQADESHQRKAGPIQYLDQEYVYKSVKSIINIKEISRYKDLIYPPLREVSIGSTAILTSPENRVLTMLKDTQNVVFLISATGGVHGDLSTSFDFRYLEDELRDGTGRSSFAPMRDQELALSEEIRAYRRQYRDITVRFFDDDISTFPNNLTREAVSQFDKRVLRYFLDNVKKENPRFTDYKRQELQNFIRFLFYLFEDDSIQEVIAFTQTLSWIRRLIQEAEGGHSGYFTFRALERHPNIYTVEVNSPDGYHSPVCIKLILYESKFDSLYRGKEGPRTYREELVESENQKIFFISAYQSAGKGLNPTIKTGPDDEEGKDFDALALLMDKYFTVMGPGTGKSKDPDKSTTQRHFALMKNLTRRGNTFIEIKDFNRYLTEQEAGDFIDLQHRLLLGKGILQAVGRTERRDFDRQTIKIFINDETRRNLVKYYRYLQQKEPNELRKLSVNNHEVFLRVMEDERSRTIQDYDSHVYAEIDAAMAFQEHRKRMLDEIDHLHEDAGAARIVEPWELLRDPLALSDPEGYLAKLRSSGFFPPDFVDSLFYRRGPDQPAFTPYLASVEEEGTSYQIVSDSANSDKEYPYQERLYPGFLKIGGNDYDVDDEEIAGMSDLSTKTIRGMYRKLIPKPVVFDEYIPRPAFFYDVFYPSFAENMVAAWIREIIFEGNNWSSIRSAYGIQPLTDFKTYHKLFERFDLFFTRRDTLFCIDVKAWSEASGYRLSQKTIDKALQKLADIQSYYPGFSEVRGLLLNLHAPQEKYQKLSSSLFAGNLFYLDANHYLVEATTLREFLFQKGR